MGAEEEDCSGGSFLFLRLVLFCEDEAGADGAEVKGTDVDGADDEAEAFVCMLRLADIDVCSGSWTMQGASGGEEIFLNRTVCSVPGWLSRESKCCTCPSLAAMKRDCDAWESSLM